MDTNQPPNLKYAKYRTHLIYYIYSIISKGSFGEGKYFFNLNKTSILNAFSCIQIKRISCSNNSYRWHFNINNYFRGLTCIQMNKKEKTELEQSKLVVPPSLTHSLQIS